MRVLLDCAIELFTPSNAVHTDIDQWWQIYKQHHNVNRTEFLKRFLSFDRIIFFREYRTKKIVGGSGFRMREYLLSNGKIVNTIYIGQSYIITKYRGHKLMAITYARVVIGCKLRAPLREIWFWMDALTYKPYLALGNHVLEYYPSPIWSTPKWIKELLDRIGDFYYPGMYDPATGVVQKPSLRLKKSVGKIGNRDLKNEHIKFYIRLNPGHIKGNGLLCIFPGSLKNVANLIVLLCKGKLGKKK